MTKTLKVARVLKCFPTIKFQIYINKALTTHHREDLLFSVFKRTFPANPASSGARPPRPFKNGRPHDHTQPHNYFSLRWDRFSEEHIARSQGQLFLNRARCRNTLLYTHRIFSDHTSTFPRRNSS